MIGVYKFDLEIMPENIRTLFTQFITDCPSLSKPDNLNKYWENVIDYDYYWINPYTIKSYTNNWYEEKRFVFIYIDEPQTPLNNKWFKPCNLDMLRKNLKNNENPKKWLKKQIKNMDNFLYKGGDTFTYFSVFFKYCVLYDNYFE
jgi:hypothetical protein